MLEVKEEVKVVQPKVAFVNDGGTVSGTTVFNITLQYPENIVAYNTAALICSPFYNCQVYTIGGIDNILDQDDPKYILERIQYQAGKSRLVVDVSNGGVLIERLEAIFKADDIVFKQEYINNTGSPMVMYMLKTRVIGHISDEDQEDFDGEYSDYDDDY